jgi:anthranilate synthase component 1
VFGFSYSSSGASRAVRLRGRVSPVDFFAWLYGRHDYTYILESFGPEGGCSFVGFGPRLVVKARRGVVELCGAGGREVLDAGDPLESVKEAVGVASNPLDGCGFAGGAVGYLSYDAVRHWERLPERAVDDLGFPDLEFGVFDDFVLFDHGSGEAFYLCLGESRIGEAAEGLRGGSWDPLSYSEPRINVTQSRFEDMVSRAKEHISSGEAFQVVVSKRYEFSFSGDLIGFYRALRRVNPSPYMYLLKMGGRQIVGSSPEMLVKVEGGVVETFPIAGTRPRVGDAAEDAALARELLLDPKERAEHVMLVDLARNDIGKVSEFGTVSVPRFMEVHQYSHVQHIVSRVTGRLRRGCDCYDALRAVFPAGTVSGAPKVRAMEIIEEAEPCRRGPYAGAVGYFSYNGNADFAITIRTLVANRDRGYIQAGAGIVADSVPEREWFETEHKASALLKALRISSEGDGS